MGKRSQPQGGHSNLPLSKIHRLLRPYITQLVSLNTRLTEAQQLLQKEQLQQQQKSTLWTPDSPVVFARIRPNDKQGRVYGSKGRAAAAAGSKKQTNTTTRSSVAAGPYLSSFPAQLQPFPPPPTKLLIQAQTTLPPLPDFPSIPLAELSRRIHAIKDAFKHIIELVYPHSSTSRLVDGLAAMCVKKVGFEIESWVEQQLLEEGKEEDGIDGDRTLELRDEWLEGIPDHYRRFAVPTLALSILFKIIPQAMPLHGLYDALLDVCLQYKASHEASLLLPSMIYCAYTIPTLSYQSIPPPALYLVWLTDKLSIAQPTFLSILPRALEIVFSEIQASAPLHLSDLYFDDELEQEVIEVFSAAVLGPSMDEVMVGLPTISSDEGSADSIHCIELIKLGCWALSTILASPSISRRTADLVTERARSWIPAFIQTSLKGVTAHVSSTRAMDHTTSCLSTLCNILTLKQYLASGAVVDKDTHLLLSLHLAASPSPPPLTDTGSLVASRRLVSFYNSSLPLLAITDALKSRGLPHLESGLLALCIDECHKFHHFMSAILTLEDLDKRLDDAERRSLGENGRWEEMVGGWVERTPNAPCSAYRRRLAVRSHGDDIENESDDGDVFGLSQNQEEESTDAECGKENSGYSESSPDGEPRKRRKAESRKDNRKRLKSKSLSLSSIPMDDKMGDASSDEEEDRGASRVTYKRSQAPLAPIQQLSALPFHLKRNPFFSPSNSDSMSPLANPRRSIASRSSNASSSTTSTSCARTIGPLPLPLTPGENRTAGTTTSRTNLPLHLQRTSHSTTASSSPRAFDSPWHRPLAVNIQSRSRLSGSSSWAPSPQQAFHSPWTPPLVSVRPPPVFPPTPQTPLEYNPSSDDMDLFHVVSQSPALKVAKKGLEMVREKKKRVSFGDEF